MRKKISSSAVFQKCIKKLHKLFSVVKTLNSISNYRSEQHKSPTKFSSIEESAKNYTWNISSYLLSLRNHPWLFMDRSNKHLLNHHFGYQGSKKHLDGLNLVFYSVSIQKLANPMAISRLIWERSYC